MTSHGKSSTYTKYKCRCPLCSEAHNASQRAWRAGRRPTPRQATPTINRPPLPEDIRTYGISRSGFDYDAAIHAAAEFSVPRPQSPNRGTRR